MRTNLNRVSATQRDPLIMTLLLNTHASRFAIMSDGSKREGTVVIGFIGPRRSSVHVGSETSTRRRSRLVLGTRLIGAIAQNGYPDFES